MKRFVFRLERVLGLRRQQERLAELRQAQARSNLQLAMAQWQAAQERLHHEASAIALRTPETLAAASRIATLRFLTHLQQQMQAEEARVKKAEQVLNEVNVQRLKVHREVESLEALRQEQWREHRREAGRITQNDLDDRMLHRWQFDAAGQELEPISDMEVMQS
jgi:flagellar export protein FliJ